MSYRYREIFSCANKVAIVTGGSGLIGKEIVKGLHEFGAKVYIADIEKSEELIGREIEHVHTDVTSEESVNKMITGVVRDAGRIDILVNSAYPRTKDWGLKFEHVTTSSWNINLNNHLGGYFLCCQKAAEQMKQQGGGTIINMASIYGVVAPDFSIYEGTEMTMPVAYSAIKGGIIALTRYIATYYAKYNVRANAVSPGGIFDNHEETFVRKYSDKTPLGRMGRPSEITGAVVFLASEASSYVTGQNLIVDGGWTAW